MSGSLLAVGLDATDLARVVTWSDAGVLPVLSRALGGRRGRVVAPAHVGSGAVWPTFTSGRPASEHGFCSDWTWLPDEMRFARARPPVHRPGWATWPDAGLRGLVVDVPFAPAARADGVAEILDWGGHDWLGDPPVIWPPSLQAAVDAAGTHGFTSSSIAIDGPTDWPLLRALGDEAATGATARGRLVREALATHPADLALVVFPELHRAGHFLWHVDRDDHPALDGVVVPPELRDAFRRVAVAVDAAVGTILAAMRPPARLVLFALHGMQPAHGVVDVLPALLESWGCAVRRPAARRGAADWLALGARLAKQAVPAALKRQYYRLAPRSVTARLAQPPASEIAYDWTRTSALAWPSDQHGWVRVSLAGREREGAVSRAAYDGTCDDLVRRLTELRTTTGEHVVARVVRVASDGGQVTPPAALPDLVVHWSPAALAPGARLATPDLAIPVLVRRVTGEHTPDGWYALQGEEPGWPESIDASALLAALARLAAGR